MSGSVGAVSYPDYIENAHAGLLDSATSYPTNLENMSDLVQEALEYENPYTDQDPYNPTPDILELKLRMSELGLHVDELDWETDWPDMVDLFVSKIDDLLGDDTEITSAVSSFRTSRKKDLAQAYNRVASQFSDINAVQGTAFPAAQALLETGYLQDVANYESQLKIEKRKEKVQLALSELQNMSKQLAIKSQALLSSIQAQQAASMTAIEAQDNYIRSGLQFDEREIKWDIGLLNSYKDSIGATAGIPGMSEGMDKRLMTAGMIFGGISSLVSPLTMLIGLL